MVKSGYKMGKIWLYCSEPWQKNNKSDFKNSGTKTYIKVSLAKKVMDKKTYLYLLVNTGTQVGPMATCPALTRHTSRTPHVAT